ncbi:MAG: hypothetical protein WBA41_10180 [Rivularia sp. (in: cyanobacteria)]
MNNCPCCKDTLLYHISNDRTYWFCPSCRQEMPVCHLSNSHSLTKSLSGRLSIIHQKLEKSSLNSPVTSANSDNLALMRV